MNNHEDGFTIVETLTAICVSGFAGMILVWFFSSSLPLLEKSKEDLLFMTEVLKTDALIRERIGDVAIPYWASPEFPRGDQHELRIPWYRGSPGNYVQIREEAAALILETQEHGITQTQVLLESLETLSITALTDDQGLPWGVDIIYVYKDKPYHIAAAFSSVPVRRKGL